MLKTDSDPPTLLAIVPGMGVAASDLSSKGLVQGVLRCVLALSMLLPLALTGCNTLPIPTTIPPVPESQYTAWHPYYFEYCALSEQNKKPGFGMELRGGIGGHSTIYLNGVCLKGTGYPELEVCHNDPADNGVGISINSHFANASWIAVPGRNFFYHGDLRPGQTLIRAVYEETKAHAQRLGLYDAIRFHDETFDDMPRGFTRDAFKYEVSIATDYAVGYGRDRYCARVALSASEMIRIADYMNGLNQPYRDGKAEFEWNVFNNNCIHAAHNALAAIGFWPELPTGRPIVLAAFDFPVPKNEFVNIMRRGNDMPTTDLMAIWRDRSARQSLIDGHGLPTRPGTLATFEPVTQINEIYDTDLLLIFYDDPVLGSYEDWYRRIVREPQYTNLGADLDRFATQFRQIRAARQPLTWWFHQHPSLRHDASFPTFYQRFYDVMAWQEAGTQAGTAILAGQGD